MSDSQKPSVDRAARIRRCSPPRPIGIVLAGGLGRRLGGPGKPFVTLAGRSMFDRVVRRLSPQVEGFIVSANSEPDRFRAAAVPVIADTLPHDAGPLAGILAGLRWTAMHRPEVRFIASVAADTPFFPANLVRALSEGRGPDGRTIALAASATGVHPVFGLWPVALADDLELFLGSGANPKVLAFANRHIRIDVPFDDIALADGTSADPFFNVNTPQDAERAEALALVLDAAEKP